MRENGQPLMTSSMSAVHLRSVAGQRAAQSASSTLSKPSQFFWSFQRYLQTFVSGEMPTLQYLQAVFSTRPLPKEHSSSGASMLSLVACIIAKAETESGLLKICLCIELFHVPAAPS